MYVCVLDTSDSNISNCQGDRTNVLTRYCWLQGKLSDAVGAYKRAIQLQPNFPEAYNNLGNALREMGRSDEAISCYMACIQLQHSQQHPVPASTQGPTAPSVRTSASFLAEISVRSPRILFVFIIYENTFWIKVSKKTFYLLLKTAALVRASCSVWNHTLLQPSAISFSKLCHILLGCCKLNDVSAETKSLVALPRPVVRITYFCSPQSFYFQNCKNVKHF